MTDYIYKLPIKLVSANGRKYSDHIFKSIRKQIKSKKLVGIIGETSFEDTMHMVNTKQAIIRNQEHLLTYKEIDDNNNLLFTSCVELPKNYFDQYELAPVYLLEGDKVTILSVNLISKSSQQDCINEANLDR